MKKAVLEYKTPIWKCNMGISKFKRQLRMWNEIEKGNFETQKVLELNWGRFNMLKAVLEFDINSIILFFFFFSEYKKTIWKSEA